MNQHITGSSWNALARVAAMAGTSARPATRSSRVAWVVDEVHLPTLVRTSATPAAGVSPARVGTRCLYVTERADKVDLRLVVTLS